MNLSQLEAWLIPALIVLGAGAVGYVFELIVLSRLRKIAERTNWEGDDIVLQAVRGVSVFWFVLAGIYFASYVFKQYPNVLNHVQKATLVLWILSITLVLAKIAGGFVRVYARRGEGLPSSSIFVNLTRVIVFIVGVLMILQTLGISITPILTALGVGGLAVALALQDTLSNLFAGLHIIASRQIRVGDYIRLDSGQEGYISDIAWRNTTVRALANNLFIIPNSKLAGAIITNYYLPTKDFGIGVDLGVSYDSDLEKVERITLEVAKEVMRSVAGAMRDAEPAVRFHTFADSSINFIVGLRVNEFTDQYLLKHELVKRLHARYKKEGIEIPFPVRTVVLKNPAEPPRP